MNEYKVPFGKKELTFTLPSELNTDVLKPETGQPLQNPEEAIRQALMNPIGSPKQRSADEIQTIGIAINDKTRPVPVPNPLNILLDHFDKLGFGKDQITLFIGSGTHQPMSETELTRLMRPEIIEKYQVIVHDCDNSPLAEVGHTPHGTPIQINADYMACDLKITVGNIEPHHFMGYSGQAANRINQPPWRVMRAAWVRPFWAW